MLVAHGKHAHELRLRNDLLDRPGKGCENGGYATSTMTARSLRSRVAGCGRAPQVGRVAKDRSPQPRKQTRSTMDPYLETHMSTLENAIASAMNDVFQTRPSNPVAFLAQRLQSAGGAHGTEAHNVASEVQAATHSDAPRADVATAPSARNQRPRRTSIEVAAGSPDWTAAAWLSSIDSPQILADVSWHHSSSPLCVCECSPVKPAAAADTARLGTSK